MKNITNALLIGCAAMSLLACGDKGGAGSGANGNVVFTNNYEPNKVPANAISREEFLRMTEPIKRLKSIIPFEEAYFNKVIVGASVQERNDRSSERTKAVGYLSPVGRKYLQEMKRKCTINNARYDNQGGQARVGGTVTSTLSMSTSGACPIAYSRQVKSSRYYRQIEPLYNNASAPIDFDFYLFDRGTRKIQDMELIRLTGIRSMSLELELKAPMKGTYSANSLNVNYRSLSTGRLHHVLMSGQTISGTINEEVVVAGSSRISQTLFDLQSSRGAIRLLVLEQTGAPNRYFMNGQPTSADDAERLGIYQK